MRNKHSSYQKIRSIADYQFGRGVGKELFPEDVRIVYSRRTGRIRQIFLAEKMLATLRPRDGLFSLTITGAKRLWENVQTPRLWVKVCDEAIPFVAKGRNVFAKHVTCADEEIRPKEEVIIVNERNEVLAVGRAILTGLEMKAFYRGMAVRVRKGVTE